MMKAGIDQAALIELFAQTSARQGEALRKAVSEATLKALQGRELTVKNLKSVLQSVTDATAAGAERSGLPAPDVEALFAQAFDGMDAAMLQAVEAQRRALQQFVDLGLDLNESKLKKALSDLEKMEDSFFDAVGKAAAKAGEPVQTAWSQALQTARMEGSDAGNRAEEAVAQLTEQARQTMRASRAMGLSAAKALMDSYAALASGVLIGMSEGMAGSPAATKSRKAPAKKGG